MACFRGFAQGMIEPKKADAAAGGREPIRRLQGFPSRWRRRINRRFSEFRPVPVYSLYEMAKLET
jgi:hypothetical protein